MARHAFDGLPILRALAFALELEARPSRRAANDLARHVCDIGDDAVFRAAVEIAKREVSEGDAQRFFADALETREGGGEEEEEDEEEEEELLWFSAEDSGSD